MLGELPCYALGLAGEVGNPPGLVRVALEYTHARCTAGASQVNGRSACLSPLLNSRDANAIQYWRVQGSPGTASGSRPHRCSRRVLRRGPGGDSRASLLGCSGRDRTTLVYGRTYAGRYLLVVVIGEGQEAFAVTARDMTEAEKKTFRRKAR